MVRPILQVKSTHVDGAADYRLDRLRRLFDHPSILAPDPSARRVLAFTPTITVSYPAAHLDRNVGARSRDHGPMAQRRTL